MNDHKAYRAAPQRGGADEAAIYPIVKQIMLGRWAWLEPLFFALTWLCLAALAVALVPPRPL